jgi:hypothetical protein
MSDARKEWAIVRQLVLATADTQSAGSAIANELQLPPGFADPELANIGLDDYVMPVGPQKFLEVVGPLDDKSYINRWLDRVGGSGGYCLSVQVPDVAACRARALALGIRLAADQTYLGHPLIQLHPVDVGILLELDGIADPAVWFWDGVTPGPRADAVIDDIVGVTVGTPDPEARAAQWAHIIGLDLLSPTSLDFSGAIIDFVANPVGQLLGARFRVADGHVAPPAGVMLGLQVSYLSRATV